MKRDKHDRKKAASVKTSDLLKLRDRKDITLDGNPQSQETLEEALVDLYLSVKIRSNDEIDAYNEDILADERD